MNTRFFVQISLLIFTSFLVLRLFPLLLRVVEASALGLAQFWWAILVIGLLIGLFLFLRARTKK
jgi:hypothetical protein